MYPSGTAISTGIRSRPLASDYAIIRVGFRGYGTSDPVKPVMQDKNVEQNIRGALAAGLDVGLYFFSQAINEGEALEEAGACVNMAREYNITYPIYFDTEFATSSHTGRADTLSRSKRTDLAVAFCEAVKNAGYTAGVYASKTFFYDELQFSRLQNYAIWVAHYTSKETDFKYSYGAWQYSEQRQDRRHFGLYGSEYRALRLRRENGYAVRWQ